VVDGCNQATDPARAAGWNLRCGVVVFTRYCNMWRALRVVVAGALVSSAGIMLSMAEEPKQQKNEIKGGIEGKVKSVDADKQTLTITAADGPQRTFTVTDDTIMLGPRGGKVRHRLKDHRFREGFAIIVVAQGAMAKELHLGFAHESGDEGATKVRTSQYEGSKPPAKGAPEPPGRVTKQTPPPDTSPEHAATKSGSRPPGKTIAAGNAPARPADEDEDSEIPGKVKSYDPTRHILVVTLLNGKSRSFILAKDVKVVVHNRASRRGLQDPALTAGVPIEIVTDQGGRKVVEVKVVPASDTGKRKAG
jgi:hypothetical protein